MLKTQIGNVTQMIQNRTAGGTKAYARVMAILASAILCCMLAVAPAAQAQQYYSPEQLDHMVSRVALYPDPLLAQVLAAATFPDQIPDAARWADQHHYLSGGELAQAIDGDQLPWDPSVQALLPFPSVLVTCHLTWTGPTISATRFSPSNRT